MCNVLCNVVAPGNSYTDELRDTLNDRNNESMLLCMQKNVSDAVLTHGQRPEFIQRPPTEINVFEREPLTLRCTVEGNPKPMGMAIFLMLMFL